MNIREYRENDSIVLKELFLNTINNINTKDYSIEQINAWSKGIDDLEKWNIRLVRNHTLIAEIDNEIVGFISMANDGLIDLLFTHPKYQNKRIATKLLKEIERLGKKKKYYTFSSITAKPFFERNGYILNKENIVRLGNVELTNYLMIKDIENER